VGNGVAVLPENSLDRNWVSHFESISAVHGWSDKENLLWMHVKLVGMAGATFRLLPPVTQELYELTKVALFEHSSNRELY